MQQIKSLVNIYRRSSAQHKSERGFTLIELLIGMGIVSVLAGLLSLIYQDYREKAYRSIAIAQAHDLKKALIAALSDTADSNLFDVDRVLRVALDGTVTCTSGCAGIDVNTIFPGYTHDAGSDLRVNMYTDSTFTIYSGHCQALNENGTRYLGWLLTNDEPVQPNEFAVGPDIANCKALVESVT
jgi:prepilin-type N-terminal cleavage/methylation domain-containing protein